MTTPWKVPLTTVELGDEEVQAVTRVLRSGWLSMGPEVEAFEAEFAAAIGATYAVAASNGTDALALAYDAVGVEEGDEVLMPALTFVASLNVALRRQERPVLVDIASEDDLTLSPADLASKIHDRTRLIVTMPYGGFAPDMESILSIARSRAIPVVEDACHAPLGRHHGKCLGTFGEAGCFSFFSNKNMTTGEGGMVVTDDRAIAERLRLLRNHGMTRSTRQHYEGVTNEYDVRAAGHNFRMDEMRAAVGRVQLRKLPAMNARRRELAAEIRQRLSERVPDLRFPNAHVRAEGSAHHLLVALLPEDVDRQVLMRAMAERGVQTSVHYRALHRFMHTTGLWKEPPYLPVTEAVEKRIVTLPLGPHMTPDQVDLLVESVPSCMQRTAAPAPRPSPRRNQLQR